MKTNSANTFKQISYNPEPSVIGVNNGVYQLEFFEKDLKKNKNYKDINKYLLGYNPDISKVEEQAIVSDLEIDFLRGSFLKKVIKTDLVVFTPHLNGYSYVISQKFLDCLINVGVTKSEYRLRKIEVDNVDFNYYLFLIPITPTSELIFPKSALFPEEDALIDDTDKRYVSFKNYNDYKKHKEEYLFSRWAKITLDKKYKNRDILNLQTGGIFFSDRLIKKLQDENITNLIVKNNPILSFN